MKKISAIVLWLLLPMAGFSQKFDLGTINGANYQICIPENWNHGLVMYAHGYEIIGEETEPFEEEVNEFMEIFTSRGFAFAASAYKRQGLVIKDGIEDTEALRSYFEMNYGSPETCIITGHSMGGIITLATIERYPSEYDGALPLCGWLAPVHTLFKNILDMLVTFDYLFGNNSGELISGEPVEAQIIQKKLDQKPEMTTLFAEHFKIRKGDLAEMIAFNQYAFIETVGWMGGLPMGNTQTIYSGFGDMDKALNRKVLRYGADPDAELLAIQYHTPTGKIKDPVLALHTTYDQIIPVYNYTYYEEATTLQQTGDLYVQQYVVRDGHCFFSLEETADALDQLLLWIKEGKRPETKYQ
jgi:dienelactone hydrolase